MFSSWILQGQAKLTQQGTGIIKQLDTGNLVSGEAADNDQRQCNVASRAGQSPKGLNLPTRQGQRKGGGFLVSHQGIQLNDQVGKGSVEEGVQNGRYRLPPGHCGGLGKILEDDIVTEGNGRYICGQLQDRLPIVGCLLRLHGNRIQTDVSKPVSNGCALGFFMLFLEGR